MNLKIIYKESKELKEYENNPRQNDRTVEKLIESIQEYGFLIPILIDKNNIIVAGHARKRAADSLKLKEVPCIYVENLTSEQVKKFRLVDNKTAEFSDWDMEKLKQEMEEIEATANNTIKDLVDIFEFINFNAESLEVNDSEFLQDTEIVKERNAKSRVRCPKCGEEFEA